MFLKLDIRNPPAPGAGAADSLPVYFVGPPACIRKRIPWIGYSTVIVIGGTARGSGCYCGRYFHFSLCFLLPWAMMLWGIEVSRLPHSTPTTRKKKEKQGKKEKKERREKKKEKKHGRLPGSQATAGALLQTGRGLVLILPWFAEAIPMQKQSEHTYRTYYHSSSSRISIGKIWHLHNQNKPRPE